MARATEATPDPGSNDRAGSHIDEVDVVQPGDGWLGDGHDANDRRTGMTGRTS